MPDLESIELPSNVERWRQMLLNPVKVRANVLSAVCGINEFLRTWYNVIQNHILTKPSIPDILVLPMKLTTLSITKEFTFDAAHQLLNGYEGKCAVLHGHTYILQVTVSLWPSLDEKKALDQYGMVVNFDKVKAAWKEVEPMFDHVNLNETLQIQTTAENIVQVLHKELSSRIDVIDKWYVSHIRLYETPTSWVDYTVSPIDMDHISMDGRFEKDSSNLI